MKNIFYCACFLFSTILFGQNYKPLLDNSNEWHFTTCYYGCLTDVYFTDGDTLVNGNTHKILDGFHYISRTFLLREEVENRKIFLTLVSDENIDEYLLYDFSLNEGDVFTMLNPISPFPANGGAFVLDSIRLKPLVDGNDYRHFYFSPTPTNTISEDNAIWIEGVGSLSLINAPGGYPNINEVGHLSCFFKNEESFYTNLDSIDSCEPIHLGMVKPINFLGELDLYVSEGQCNLTPAKNVSKVVLFDLSGKFILQKLNFSENNMSINMSDIKSGVYILIAYDTNSRKKVFKLILK